MAASIYMILGRIIQLTAGEHHALLKRKWLTKTFVTGDVLSLCMQSCGKWQRPALYNNALAGANGLTGRW